MAPQITPNSPAMLAQTASKKRPQPHGVGQVLPRQGVPANSRDGHGDQGRRRNESRLDGCAADDEPADDGDRLPNGLGQADACLLQQLKGDQQPQDLQYCRKGDRFLALDDRLRSASGIISG